MYIVLSLMQKVSCQEGVNMFEKLERRWLQQEGVYVFTKHQLTSYYTYKLK